jgi:hypothetical protein
VRLLIFARLVSLQCVIWFCDFTYPSESALEYDRNRVLKPIVLAATRLLKCDRVSMTQKPLKFAVNLGGFCLANLQTCQFRAYCSTPQGIDS